MPDPLETRSVAAVAGENTISPFAGKPAPKDMLLDVPRLERDYFERRCKSQTHLNAIVSEAQAMVNNAFTLSGPGR